MKRTRLNRQSELKLSSFCLLENYRNGEMYVHTSTRHARYETTLNFLLPSRVQGGELVSSLVRAQARVRAVFTPANAHARLKTPACNSTLLLLDFVPVLLWAGGDFLDSFQPGRWRRRRRQNSTAGVVSQVSLRKPLVGRKEGTKEGRNEGGLRSSQ